jgi:hypothetical protein
MLINLIPANLTSKGQRYAAVLDGRTLCTSRQPLYEAARVLLGEGVDPDTVLEATRQGQDFVAMRSAVGEAAGWTIEEAHGRLRKGRWEPYEMDSGGDGWSRTGSRRSEVHRRLRDHAADFQPAPARSAAQDEPVHDLNEVTQASPNERR